MPVVPDAWEAKIGGLWFKANPGKKLVRPYLKELACWCTPVISERKR
jgi:hypothetical protein